VGPGEARGPRGGGGRGGDALFPTEAEEREAEGLRAGLLLGKAEGLHAGKAEGLLAGKAEGLRQAVGVACELLSIELTPARRARLASLDAEGLEALLAALRARRRWPR
jgi:flagellar biosynthesis/type III secretory pathway protein FliH